MRRTQRTFLVLAVLAACFAAPGAGASPIPAMPELWLMNADGTEEERFSDLEGYGVTLDWSPDGQRVVFAKHGQIIVADRDGSNQSVISNEGESAYAPDWSPNGAWIAYSTCCGAEGSNGLKIVAPDGSLNRLLVPGRPPDGVAWAPDSSRLSYVKGGEGQPGDLYVVEVMTGTSSVLAADTALYTETDWSFDGEWIVFLGWNSDVRTIRSDGSETHVVFSSAYWNSDPEWSPAENVLAFSADGNILLSDPFGVVETLTEGFQPTWSPDGSSIAFARDQDIWKLRLSSGAEERLTDERLQDDADPEWSPDGSMISFVRTRVQVYCNYGEYGVEANIIGTAASEVIRGTEGRDVIAGLDGDDEIYGLQGDDIICGGRGADVIHGDQGVDHLGGDEGGDFISGGDGDDILRPGAGDDTSDGAGGRDTISYEGAPRSVVVDLLRGLGRGWGTDDLTSIENVVGGDHDDILRGDGGRNEILGDPYWGRGEDRLIGRRGPDLLSGGHGSDYLDGGRGRDELDGGRGDDRCRRGESLVSC